MTEERGEQDRVLRSIEWGLEVAAAPVVLGAEIDVVQGVHVDPHDLTSREHVAHHVNQTAKATRKGLQVFFGDRVVEALLNNVAVEHVEVVPCATAEGDVIGFGDIGEKRVPEIGHSGLVIVRSTGEALFEVSKGSGVGGIGEP